MDASPPLVAAKEILTMTSSGSALSAKNQASGIAWVDEDSTAVVFFTYKVRKSPKIINVRFNSVKRKKLCETIQYGDSMKHVSFLKRDACILYTDLKMDQIKIKIKSMIPMAPSSYLEKSLMRPVQLCSM